MGLFSDLDWVIILGVAAFLLLGHGGATTMRQLGRWYGRAMRLKQELVSELARTAELPMPAGGAAGSLRTALLGLGSVESAAVGIPAAVRTPPSVPGAREPVVPLPWTGGYPVTSWSATFFGTDRPGGELR